MMKTKISKLGWIAGVALLLGHLPVVSTARPIILKTYIIGSETKSNEQWMHADSQEKQLFIVQWKDIVHEDEKNTITRLGVEILEYINENSFLVYSSPSSMMKAKELLFVDRILPYTSAMKLDASAKNSNILNGSELIDVMVETRPGASIEFLAQAFLEPLMRVNQNLFLGRTLRSKILEIAESANVLWIEESRPFQTMEFKVQAAGGKAQPIEPPPPGFTDYESGTKLMNVDAAYAAGFNGAGQLVGYGDTGLDRGDLVKIIPDFHGQIAKAYAVAIGGKSWADPVSHGTHVAGSIVGAGTSSEGHIRGAAWGAKLVVEGMWSDLMNNIFPPSTDILFDTSYREGARIHSDSWGRDVHGQYDAMAKSVDKYAFDHQDFLAVFAAGNSGVDLNKDGVIDEGSVGSPATAKNVITVGASKNYLLAGGLQKKMIELRNGATNWGAEPIASSKLSENADGLAAFSSRGPTSDGRIKPDVVAPGTNIVSARSTDPRADSGWGPFNDHYLYMGGTSMATPLTSGALADVRQFLLARMETTSISGALLKAVAINSAHDLYPGQFGIRPVGQEEPTPRPNNHEGWGRIDLANLMVPTSGAYEFHDELKGLMTGEKAEITFRNDDAREVPLRVTLAYSDAPPASTSGKALVNDLDVSVTTPSGTVLYPNHLNGKDGINNVEHIEVQRQEIGTYKITVVGANVPQGKSGRQPYALVVFR